MIGGGNHEHGSCHAFPSFREAGRRLSRNDASFPKVEFLVSVLEVVRLIGRDHLRRRDRQDLTEPFTPVDGRIPIPTGPGIGVTPIPEIVAEFATSRTVVRP